MARIRYLKPEFWDDREIAKLTFEERLCFQGLWNFADKEGRLRDDPEWLKIKIFPYDNVDVEKCLERLARNKNTGKPFIHRYEVDGQRYIQILEWHKHQKPHHTEQDSTIPRSKTVKEPLNNGVTTSISQVKSKGMEKGQVKEEGKDECDKIFTFLTGLDLETKDQTKIVQSWQPGLKTRGRCYDCEKCKKDFMELVRKAKAAKPERFGAYFVKVVNNHITGD